MSCPSHLIVMVTQRGCAADQSQPVARRGRLFQFAAKYWFGCSASLVGILWLSQDVPSLRPWNPLYVIFTMVVILSEKVPVGPRLPHLHILLCVGMCAVRVAQRRRHFSISAGCSGGWKPG